MAPDLYPFLDSGQLKGLLGGLAGAAEYETLIDRSGQATKGMSAVLRTSDHRNPGAHRQRGLLRLAAEGELRP